MPLTKNPYIIKSTQVRKWRGNHAARVGTRLPEQFVATSSNLVSSKVGQTHLRNGCEVVTPVPDGLLTGAKHTETALIVGAGDKLFMHKWLPTVAYPASYYPTSQLPVITRPPVPGNGPVSDFDWPDLKHPTMSTNPFLCWIECGGFILHPNIMFDFHAVYFPENDEDEDFVPGTVDMSVQARLDLAPFSGWIDSVDNSRIRDPDDVIDLEAAWWQAYTANGIDLHSFFQWQFIFTDVLEVPYQWLTMAVVGGAAQVSAIGANIIPPPVRFTITQDETAEEVDPFAEDQDWYFPGETFKLTLDVMINGAAGWIYSGHRYRGDGSEFTISAVAIKDDGSEEVSWTVLTMEGGGAFMLSNGVWDGPTWTGNVTASAEAANAKEIRLALQYNGSEYPLYDVPKSWGRKMLKRASIEYVNADYIRTTGSYQYDPCDYAR